MRKEEPTLTPQVFFLLTPPPHRERMSVYILGLCHHRGWEGCWNESELITWLREHRGKILGIVCESLLIMTLGYGSLI